MLKLSNKDALNGYSIAHIQPPHISVPKLGIYVVVLLSMRHRELTELGIVSV